MFGCASSLKYLHEKATMSTTPQFGLKELADLIADAVFEKFKALAEEESVQLQVNVCPKCNLDGTEVTTHGASVRSFICAKCAGQWTAGLETFK